MTLDPKALEVAASILAPVWPGGFEDQSIKPLSFRPNSAAREVAAKLISTYLAALLQAEPSFWHNSLGEMIHASQKSEYDEVGTKFPFPLFASQTPAVSRENVMDAAIEWLIARSAFISLGMNHPDGKSAFNRLSNAEDALAKAIRTNQG